MPTFASQLSNDQLTHLAQKSVALASRKYSAGFMQAALDETDRLSDRQLRQLVEMPDFGEAVASWYGAYLFFTGGEWQRWIERHALHRLQSSPSEHEANWEASRISDRLGLELSPRD